MAGQEFAKHAAEKRKNRVRPTRMSFGDSLSKIQSKSIHTYRPTVALDLPLKMSANRSSTLHHNVIFSRTNSSCHAAIMHWPITFSNGCRFRRSSESHAPLRLLLAQRGHCSAALNLVALTDEVICEHASCIGPTLRSPILGREVG